MNHSKFSGLNEFIIIFYIHIITGFYKGMTTFAERLTDMYSSRCIDPFVKILVNTAHTIIFEVDEVVINRAEFIIRRCNGVRTYSIENYFEKKNFL